MQYSQLRWNKKYLQLINQFIFDKFSDKKIYLDIVFTKCDISKKQDRLTIFYYSQNNNNYSDLLKEITPKLNEYLLTFNFKYIPKIIFRMTDYENKKDEIIQILKEYEIN